VDGEDKVHRKPRGIVTKQEEFRQGFYKLGLNPDRDVFREAMKRIQAEHTVDEVLTTRY